MKKLASLLLSAAMLLGLAACGGTSSSVTASSEAASEAASSSAASSEAAVEENTLSTADPVRIAGLKGPTTMGLVNLLPMQEDGTANLSYDLQLYGTADEIVPLLTKGELDMAAIPANLAATLYQKTEGAIQVMAVNTLGVLYVVEKGDTVQSVADLKGRTILSTGKGTTPEYVLRYILAQNGIDPDNDVTIEFYSEATEVTAQMAVAGDAIAVLPQPYVTSASMQGRHPAGGPGPDRRVGKGLRYPAHHRRDGGPHRLRRGAPRCGGGLPGGLRRQRGRCQHRPGRHRRPV